MDLLLPKGGRVILESPYAGDVQRNLRYLRAALHDSIVTHGEAPFASHGLYTQDGVLNDDIPEERKMGIEYAFDWRTVSNKTVFYCDLGMSRGMLQGLYHAIELKQEIVFRYLGGEWATNQK